MSKKKSQRRDINLKIILKKDLLKKYYKKIITRVLWLNLSNL